MYTDNNWQNPIYANLQSLSLVRKSLSRTLTEPRRRDLTALAIFIILSLVLFRDSILHGQLFYEPDTVTFYYPVMSAVDRALDNNTIPLWTPYIFGGFPLFADGEAGMLYPFNLLFSWLMPIQDAFIWLQILRFFLAGAFTYTFVRCLGGKWTSALTAGIVFAFGSFMVTQMHHTNVGNSAIWLPLVLCFIELALQANGLRRQMLLLLGGLAFGIQSLGVHVQPVLMTWFAMSLYIAFRVLVTGIGTKARWGDDFQPARDDIRPLLQRIKAFGPDAARRLAVKGGLIIWMIGVVTCVGFGLAAIQLFPLYELGMFSFRGEGVSLSFATLYSLPLYNLASLVFPYFFIRPDGSTWSLWVEWESTVYVGIAPLILAFIAACFSRKRLVVFFVGLACLSLLLAFGDYLPIDVYSIVWRLPGFSVLRAPARFSYLFVFSCAILAAVGLDWLSSSLVKSPTSSAVGSIKAVTRSAGRSLLIFTAGVGGLTVLVVASLLYAQHWLNDNKATALQVIQDSYLQLRHHNFSLSAENVYNSLCYSLDLSNMKTIQSILLLIAVVTLILLWYRFRSQSNVWRGALIFVIAVDLMLFAEDFHPTIPIESLSVPSGAERFLTSQGGLYRVYNKIPGVRTEPNRLLPFRLASVGGYSSLETIRHQDYMGPIVDGDRRLLNLWNVRYIISQADVPSRNNYKVAYQNGDTVVYENDSYLPRAFLVGSVVVVPPGHSVLNRMRAKDFNPATTAVVERPSDWTVLPGGVEKGESSIQVAPADRIQQTDKVNILDYQRESVAIDVTANANAFLVLTDSYYPGWKAYLDGQEVKIYRADYLFRAVYVPAGSHTVKFVFEPTSFELGRTISITTLFILIAASVYGLFVTRLQINRKVSVAPEYV